MDLGDLMNPEIVPNLLDLHTGLCANKEDHEAHLVLEGSMAPFWCTAIQSDREPWRSEQRRRESK
jgi:hypothetical protein